LAGIAEDVLQRLDVHGGGVPLMDDLVSNLLLTALGDGSA
jgi:hypothetical protein